MELPLILIYVLICLAVFKFFKMPTTYTRLRCLPLLRGMSLLWHKADIAGLYGIAPPATRPEHVALSTAEERYGRLRARA